MAYTYGAVTNCKVRNGQTRDEYECRLGYEVQSQDNVNNTSTIKLRLECRSISSSYTTKGSSGLTSIIDGTTVKSNAAVDMSSTNTWQNFGERTITVTHNANGKYSASKSGSFTCTAGSSNYSLSSGSASVTVAPATIPRYAYITQHYVSSVGTNSITVYWDADVSCDAVQYSLNGGSWSAVSGYPQYTITGLAANTQYSIRTRVKRTDSQLWTESGTIYGTTYPNTIPSIWQTGKSSSSISVNSSCNVDVNHTAYRIRRHDGSWGNWQSSGTFSGLNSNTTYVIQVEKRGTASGEYGYAEAWIATFQVTVPSIWLSSKTINSIAVDSGCNISASATHYRIRETSGSYGNWQTSNTFWGLNPNTTYEIQVEKYGSENGEYGWASLTVTTYDIARISSASNFNLGDSEVISYSNPSGSTMYLALYELVGDSFGKVVCDYRQVTGSSYTFTLTDSESDILYSLFKNSNTANVRVYLRTHCNDVTYYDYKNIVVTLTGNQKTAHIGVGSAKKRAKVFLGVNGSVKRAVIWIGNNGRKRCI